VIAECRQWLTDLLRVAVEGRVYDTEAAEGATRPLPNAVLVVGQESAPVRDGARVAREDLEDGGTRRWRRRLWIRRLPIDVRVEHKDAVQAEAVLQRLLASAFQGLRDRQGNFIRVRPNRITWTNDKAATAGGKTRATCLFEFEGGVFDDRDVPRVLDVTPVPDGTQGA